MKVIVESDVSERVPPNILSLLTEISKTCNIDIWITTPQEEIELEGYGHGI